ncbi:hypothetical protein [Roseisalinus antarcticus]|nr:hypothetical protein [Roseisalinus antarcticus]
MRWLVTCALISGTALSAQAETPLDAEAFDAITQGRTLTFLVDGAPYGIERYMADRRVLWSFLDGQCALGEWYPQDDSICFLYDIDPEAPQCWEVFKDGDGLRTVFTEDPDRPAIYRAREGDEEMICENFGT